MANDIEFPAITEDTTGDEAGVAWPGGEFLLSYGGPFGAAGGTLTFGYSRKQNANFRPVIADPVNETAFAATSAGTLLGKLPAGYVRLQFADAQANTTNVAAFMRPVVNEVQAEIVGR